MEWFKGQISAGIAEAKTQNTLFVVYIYDDSEESKKMDKTWEASEVSSTCKEAGLIAVHFRSDSTECKQFSQFYPVLVVPSVTFISGQTGVCVEGVAGAVGAQEFVEKIQKALKDFRSSSNQSMQPFAQVTRATRGSVDVPNTAPSPQAASPPTSTEVSPAKSPPGPTESVQERAARLRQKMEEVHRRKQKQKEEELKTKEIERRKVGQAVQKAQQQRDEQQGKEFANELRKQRMEDKLAKQQVREQIARDRAEKQARYDEAKKVKEETQSVRSAEEEKRREVEERARNAARMETARLQFRLPDGSTINNQFPSSAKLREVEDFVRQNSALVDIQMSTTFPRRQFTQNEMDSSLLELQLAPSAAVVVLPSSSKRSSAVVSSSDGGFISLLLYPFLLVWNFIWGLFFGSSSNSSSTSPPQESRSPSTFTGNDDSYRRMGARPKSSYVRRRTPADGSSGRSRREGNIHRFNSSDDNDDENNTWNGNSTQQM